MKGHTGFATLVDLAEGADLPRERGEHAAGCAGCGGALAWLREALAALGAGAAAEPPRAVIRRAVRIPVAARVRGAVDAVRTLVARLVFDSAADVPRAVPAFRGGTPRQLLYRAGPWDLDLAVTAEGVRGSLLPREEGGKAPPRGSVRLLRGRRTLASGDLDARGRFSLPAVPGGRCDLVVRSGGDEVRVEGLVL